MRMGDRPWLLRGAVIGIALVVGLVAWLTTRGGEGEATPVEASPEVRIVSAGELPQVAAQSGHPVYWAGAMPGTNLELSESEGNVQIRYLPEGAAAGDEGAEALTVGSYPLPDPRKALDEFAARPGSVVHHAGDGREVVVSEENPTSAYFVSPDDSVQIEVYDPSPARALRLALSARVRPAG